MIFALKSTLIYIIQHFLPKINSDFYNVKNCFFAHKKFKALTVIRRSEPNSALSGLGSSHCVEFLCEFALLVSCGILVENAVCNRLVNLLDSFLVSFSCGCLVSCGNSCIELLELGLELRTEHLVLKCLSFDNLDALLGGFDVCQNFHLP